jgi:hypothetical protein
MHSTSKLTCSLKTSATLRATVTTRLRSDGGQYRPTNRELRFIHRAAIVRSRSRSRPTGVHAKSTATTCLKGWGEARLGSNAP